MSRAHFAAGNSLESQTDRIPLLQNMSAPPKTQVAYAGLRALVRTSGTSGTGGAGVRHTGVGTFGMPVRFALPRLYAKKSAAQLLRSLKLGAGRPDEDPAERLADFINQRADALPLPDGCAVIPARPEHRIIWNDGLTILAILAKCSDAIWLRSKDPAIDAALEMNQVTLLVPPAFVPSLPEFLP